MTNNKIWIDLDNSPHVLFFNPIIKELRKIGLVVVVTARDYAQVLELTELFNIDCKKVGRHYGKNKIFKVLGLVIRSLQLLPFLLKERPSLALSHGSRTQLFIAKLTGLPTVLATDYEHTQSMPFFVPDLTLVPEMISIENTNNVSRIIAKYPGIKEDVYVQDFSPDLSLSRRLGINENKIIVTIRPPAAMAHYHSAKSDNLFETVVDCLGKNVSIQMVIVPRTKDQEHAVRVRWSNFIARKVIIIPDQVMNGLDLVWCSDLVISAGGTMIREAAALSVPAYSIFGGKIGAVDRYLSDSGRLKLITCVSDIKNNINICKREYTDNSIRRNPYALKVIVENIEKVLSMRERKQ